MTDTEIIKALECYANNTGCIGSKCPIYNYITENDDCYPIMAKNALDLVNRQKAEIERLEAEIDRQYEQVDADILANIADGGASCRWCIEQHKAEAIKEFAERLKANKDKLFNYIYSSREFDKYIDNLVIEMTEDSNEKD